MPRRAAAGAVGLLCVGVLLGCSARGGRSGSTQHAADAVRTVTASPTATAPLGPRLVATIDVDNPDGLVVVAGSVWVKTDDGRAVRIDPRTNKVTGVVHLDTAREPNHYCQGIGTDGTAVWACAASDSTTGIVRIDPATLKRGRTIPVGKIFTQLALPHTARGIWVLTGTGSTLTVVDPTSAAMTSYELGSRCAQVAASELVVAVSCAQDGILVLVDPTTGHVLGRVPLDRPGIAAVSGREVWVDTASGLSQVGSDLKVRAVYPGLVVGADGDLAVDGGQVWVRGTGGRLWRIDPAQETVVEQVTPDEPLGGGSLLLTADAIWASANDEGRVLRITR